ncbi:preprotein translocase subunit SecA [Candidatus Absconditicoccus praedator]|nr:preprotein translocase subunit SecA [Candidatus Absconditicoccus praedator]UFX82997.1 preprotein translocase subunit SecA [Candidatus Absconditicoccus praedator]
MPINWLLGFFASQQNKSELKKLKVIVDQINEFDKEFENLSDEDIQQKTDQFKERFERGESLDSMLPEAFATVKQACKRLHGNKFEVKGEEIVWDMVPFDVQLMGGIVLHYGRISEMKTGEGKTLVATLPAYLNAVTGRGVHIVTVNDYLATRDAEWMGILYNWLGLSVGSITKQVSLGSRKEEYQKDVVYVENSELGFDYLRDNLTKSLDERKLLIRPLNFAIVDEVDSILIDEARTPLIISQPSAEPTDKYEYYKKIVKDLEPSSEKKRKPKGFIAQMLEEEDEEDKKEQKKNEKDYYVDEKLKTIQLTSNGIQKLEKTLGVNNLYKDLGYDEIHHIENAIKAKSVFQKDKDYIVRNNQVMLVDEHTGRVMPGRRFSEGLHQALEAKEGVAIQKESKTVASITYQNFFKQYSKLSGMTGTALTEAEEFEKIYELATNSIPTHRDIIRVDKKDKVFFNQDAKWKTVIEDVAFVHKIGQPILIGTSSINTSEIVSSYLREKAINHYVLNAKYHEQEANIIKNAGNMGSVVVATNMAGRGTDIKLEDGLNEKLALNYAKWIKNTITSNNYENKEAKNLSVNIYSQKELGYLLQGIKEYFEIDLDFKTDCDFVFDIQDLSASFSVTLNKKKQSKDDIYATLNIDVGNNEYVYKDFHFGMYILGTEKHESRRIDNQLRGRAGRQGDPGVTQFAVALDDELMRKMGGEKIQNMASMLLPKEELQSMQLTQSQFSSSIERSQKQMEGWLFGNRKQLFEYDSVVNKQRQRIYSKRDQIIFSNAEKEDPDSVAKEFGVQIEGFDIVEEGRGFIKSVVDKIVPTYTNVIPWDLDQLITEIEQISNIKLEKSQLRKFSREEDLKDFLVIKIQEHFDEKINNYEKEHLEKVFNVLYLSCIDRLWISHIDEMQQLREKVGLFGYAQIDPLMEYKRQAFDKFQKLLFNIEKEALSRFLKADYEKLLNSPYLQNENNGVDIANLQKSNQKANKNNSGGVEVVDADEDSSVNVVKKSKSKPSPNDPCPCGSGKKYKKCCGVDNTMGKAEKVVIT